MEVGRKVFDATAVIPAETFEQKLSRLVDQWKQQHHRTRGREVVSIVPARRHWLDRHCGLAMIKVFVVFAANGCRERHPGMKAVLNVCQCAACDYWHTA